MRPIDADELRAWIIKHPYATPHDFIDAVYDQPTVVLESTIVKDERLKPSVVESLTTTTLTLTAIHFVWQALEYILDGGLQPSRADTVIFITMGIFLYKFFRRR